MRKNKENIDFEIEFYEKLVKEKPNYVDALIPLANAYTKRGEYHKGLKIDKKLAELNPEDPITFYNIACSYSLLDKPQKALQSLEKAFKLGYHDLDYLMQDKDLDNIKNTKSFHELIRKYFKSVFKI